MHHAPYRAHSLAVMMLPLLLAGCASGGASGGRPSGPLAANPSAYVAADLAFSRAAQEKGQVAAFREKAHPEALLIRTDAEPLREALRRQSLSPEAMRWQPHGVYSSCDGNIALTYGAWQAGEKQGRYQTLWLRDARGEMRWRADQRLETSAAADAPEYIASKSATCRPRAPAPEGVAVAAGAGTVRADHSLTWSIEGRADGRKDLVVSLWDGQKFVVVTGDQAER